MSYKRNDLLNNYDIFPLVILKNKPTEIHIVPTGCRAEFEIGKEYKISINAIDGGDPEDFPATGDFKFITAVCNDKGGFDICHTFDKEQEYFIVVFNDEGKTIRMFPVYCVDEDMKGRYPFIGDLHMHTYLSDGRQSPEVVAANYRKYGYDFTVISDHRRYYPSLRAINAYKDVKIEMNIVPGEEVHLPPVYGKTNDVHIVNFGGEYSINAITEGSQTEEMGEDEQYRSLYGKCPPVLSYEDYQEKMQKLIDECDVPEYIDKVPYAVCCWIFDEIRKANGLGIFAHPTWKRDSFHIPEAFSDYMLEQKPFDAFEVLGGESYFEQNGFQTIKYYETMAKGVRLPIVGSTDSHSSYETNKNAFICETMVFAYENERKEIIKSIKDFYSVAIDTISDEYRIVGESRNVKYARFLLDNFFPIHDELCYEEGRLMKQYVTGTDEEKELAAKELDFINGRMKKQREKYFSF